MGKLGTEDYQLEIITFLQEPLALECVYVWQVRLLVSAAAIYWAVELLYFAVCNVTHITVFSLCGHNAF